MSRGENCALDPAASADAVRQREREEVHDGSRPTAAHHGHSSAMLLGRLHRAPPAGDLQRHFSSLLRPGWGLRRD